MFSLAPEFTKAFSAASNVFALHDQHRPSLHQQPTDNNDALEITYEKPSPSPSTTSEEKAAGARIEFRNVGLTYSTRPSGPAFTNLSFTIEPGEFVALVGPSGAGKSSIITLLERFVDPTSGSILIDDIDIRQLSLRHHRERLSLVAQEPSLFSGPVAFNVSLGARPGHRATQEEIESVCKTCDVHDFIMSLPEGYQT
jgi:ATP-binding cassette subfamily B (MDR/TAP) protein 1